MRFLSHPRVSALLAFLILPVILPTQSEANLVIAADAQVQLHPSGKLSIAGDLTNLGTFDATNATLIFSGATNSLLSNSGTASIDNVSVDKSNGAAVELDGDLSLSGDLTLTQGYFQTSGHTLALGETGNVIGEQTGSYVVGTLTVSRVVGAGASDMGGIGVDIGTGGDDVGTVSVTRISGPTGAVVINDSTGINRQWQIQSTQPPTNGRDLTFSWVGDDDNGIDLTSAQTWKSEDSGASWARVGDVTDVSLNRAISVNTTTFSHWTINDLGNNAPETADQVVTVDEDDSTPVTVSATDPDGDEMTFALVDSTQHGTLIVSSIRDPRSQTPGTTPNIDTRKTNKSTGVTADGLDQPNLQVNEKPMLSGSANPVGTQRDSRDLTANRDSRALTLDQNYTYVPDLNYSGPDSFTYRVYDVTGKADTATVFITVSPINDAPEAVADEVSTAENTDLEITLVGSDVDDDPLTFSIVDHPVNGTLTPITTQRRTHRDNDSRAEASAAYTYSPGTDFSGLDSLSFEVSDGALKDTAWVMVSVGAASFMVDISSGWNMLGLAATVDDPTYSTLYTNALSNTFYEFTGSYSPPANDEFVSGTGYWLRFPADEIVSITGVPVESVTINMSAGWNMISGPACAFDADLIVDSGNIIVPSTLYEFSGSYVAADSLEPNVGYWLRVDQAGPLTMDCGATRSAAMIASTGEPDFELTTSLTSTLQFADAAGRQQELFVTRQELTPDQAEQFSLPPMPFNHLFDVRYTDESRVANWTDGGEVAIQGIVYPLTISVDQLPDEYGYGYVLSEMMGDVVVSDHALASGTEIVLEIPTVSHLTVRRVAETPLDYTVWQNYPNPFNPVTAIRYAIPQAHHVNVRVYDITGRLVKTLVDEPQTEGFYEAVWDGRNEQGVAVSSGTYFYQIKVGDFNATKRMALLK